MTLGQSYFFLGDLAPRRLLERALNPYRHQATVTMHNTPLDVLWSGRAGKVLSGRDKPLHVEMQLYFSCVVKKRVLFHEYKDDSGITVKGKLNLEFVPVEASSCDPVEFASNYPVRRVMDSPAAGRMHPSVLRIDFRKGRWEGEFDI